MNKNKLFIPGNICLNTLNGDPCPQIVKKLFIKYTINGYEVEEEYNENLKNNIEMNTDGPYLFTFGWINSLNKDLFEQILQNVTYHSDFIVKSNLIKNKINPNKKINVIHIRLEDDAIIHWSKQNNMSCDKYRHYLENKYIDLIKKYISDTDENIILTSSLSNGVIQFLDHHHYNYTFVNKYFMDREKNAIIDLLVSECCNNVFIGNYNIKNSNGSSFSYYIWKHMNENVVNIYIDLDKIQDKEVILYK